MRTDRTALFDVGSSGGVVVSLLGQSDGGEANRQGITLLVSRFARSAVELAGC